MGIKKQTNQCWVVKEKIIVLWEQSRIDERYQTGYKVIGKCTLKHKNKNQTGKMFSTYLKLSPKTKKVKLQKLW